MTSTASYQPPLFPDLEADGVYPQQLLEAARFAAGVRYVLLGEDDLFVMLLGHSHEDDALAAFTEVARDLGESPPSRLGLQWLTPVLLTSCPRHQPPDPRKFPDCRLCGWSMSLEAGPWFVTWEAEWQHLPGKFPAVVCDTGTF